jgi:hypothetical protein
MSTKKLQIHADGKLCIEKVGLVEFGIALM